MRSLCTVHVLDYLRQFFDVRHTVASTRSPTLQKSRSTPAAIAGVQRSELCRRTKL